MAATLDELCNGARVDRRGITKLYEYLLDNDNSSYYLTEGNLLKRVKGGTHEFLFPNGISDRLPGTYHVSVPAYDSKDFERTANRANGTDRLSRYIASFSSINVPRSINDLRMIIGTIKNNLIIGAVGYILSFIAAPEDRGLQLGVAGSCMLMGFAGSKALLEYRKSSASTKIDVTYLSDSKSSVVSFDPDVIRKALF